MSPKWINRARGTAAAVALLVAAGACGSRAPLPPAGAVDADKYLYERGIEALGERHWFEAREYFRRLVDTYPRSPFRPDAKLGIGDAYFGEGRIDSQILAANEYREFLTFFPLHPRADYAQYRLALSYAEQVLAPRRDQTATREALREVERFIQNFPNSSLMPDAEDLARSLRDRLGDYEYNIAVQYFRMRLYPGSMLRLQYILEHYPEYSRKDQVYFYIAEMLLRANQGTEALIWYEKLLAEYPDSRHAEDAKKRIAEIKH
ncbi:MAG TPA: outer membrane protein assembly factor BamD [Vicinamibacterales bacterium]|nr:outer membrane protein assembly factor BamD [Vicinamibacterales bacterium]